MRIRLALKVANHICDIFQIHCASGSFEERKRNRLEIKKSFDYFRLKMFVNKQLTILEVKYEDKNNEID